MMFSLISIEICNFDIVGLDKIVNLFFNIKAKDYLNMLNYINFEIIIRMRLFGKITLVKITLKSGLIQKIIKKIIKKNDSKTELKDKLENNSKNNSKDNLKVNQKNNSKGNLKVNSKDNSIINEKNGKNEKKTKKGLKNFVLKLICKMFKIAEIKLNCSIGLSRADITSIMIGIFNCLISSIIGYYFTKDSKKKMKIETKDINYSINPIYSEKVEIRLCLVAGISSKIY